MTNHEKNVQRQFRRISCHCGGITLHGEIISIDEFDLCIRSLEPCEGLIISQHIPCIARGKSPAYLQDGKMTGRGRSVASELLERLYRLCRKLDTHASESISRYREQESRFLRFSADTKETAAAAHYELFREVFGDLFGIIPLGMDMQLCSRIRELAAG